MYVVLGRGFHRRWSTRAWGICRMASAVLERAGTGRNDMETVVFVDSAVVRDASRSSIAHAELSILASLSHLL